MKRFLLGIDFEIFLLEVVVTLLVIGGASMITFAPGNFQIIRVIAYCSIPALVIFEPMIVVGTIDRWEQRMHAIRYFAVNTLVALTFGIVSGLIVFGFLPDKHTSQNTHGSDPVGISGSP